MLRNKTNLSLITGTYLVLSIFLTVFVSTLLFIINVPVTKINLPAALVLAAIICCILSGDDKKTTGIAVVIGVAIILLSVFIGCCGYDWSWDGNAYHKIMQAAMKDGWNPLHQSFFAFAEGKDFLENINASWYDAYPKATELWSACVYKIAGNIEAGKGYHFIGMAATFFISYGFISENRKYKIWQSFICAVFLAVNPIALIQRFTYYNDAFLYQMVLICALRCVYINFNVNERYSPLAYTLVFTTINIGFNVKFSGVIYFAVVCGFYFIYWFIKNYKGSKEDKTVVGYRFILFAISVIFGFCVTGSTAYVTNVIRYKNPFHTLIGPGAANIIDSHTPERLLGISKIKSFFISLFSGTTNSASFEGTKLKIPFTVQPGEVEWAWLYDVRIAGWGIFFSGIFLISVFILAVAIIYYKKANKPVFENALVILTMYVVCICFVPSMWWARYFVAPMYIPVFAMLFMFEIYNKFNTKRVVTLIGTGVITVLLFANMVPALRRTIGVVAVAGEDKKEIMQLKQICEESTSPVKVAVEWDFYGRIYTLYDNGVTNIEYDVDVLNDYTGYVFFEQALFYKQ